MSYIETTLKVVAVTFVTVVACAVLWWFCAMHSSAKRLRKIGTYIVTADDHRILAEELESVYRAGRVSLNGAIEYSKDWRSIPPGLVALRPDSLDSNDRSAFLSWRGLFGQRLSLGWDREEGLVIIGDRDYVPSGRCVLLPIHQEGSQSGLQNK